MEPLKNLFSIGSARRTVAALRRGDPEFSEEAFLDGLAAELEVRELKQRVRLFADRIDAQLSRDTPTAFVAMVEALPRDDKDTVGLSGMAVWPLTEIVARRGLPHFEASMNALRAMTRPFTAEYAIRPFLRLEQERTLACLAEWVRDPDEHVRRLASEGSRPLLPWGERLAALQADPELTLPLLQALKDDPSEYVRRSVANHLNDHSKTHPERIVAVLGEWLGAKSDATGKGSLTRLARHASRTLLKAGHPDALRLHGFAPSDVLELGDVRIGPARLRVGEALDYQFVIRNRSGDPAKVLFDYAIHHRKANGGLTAKVFKGRTRTLAPGESWEVVGRHPLRLVTTRRYHPGTHQFEVRINGLAGPAQNFELLVPS